MGKESDTLGAVHGAFSQSHRNRIPSLIPHRLFRGFRLRDITDHRAGHALGCAFLFHKYLCSLGVRTSLRVLWKGTWERTWRANRALLGSIAHLADFWSRRSVRRPHYCAKNLADIAQDRPS